MGFKGSNGIKALIAFRGCATILKKEELSYGDYLAEQKRNIVLGRKLPDYQRSCEGSRCYCANCAELREGQALPEAPEKAARESPLLLVHQEEGRADRSQATRNPRLKVRTIAFFSYARRDDDAVGGLLTKIREKLEIEIQVHAGEEDLEVFQDTDDIEPGDPWEQRLRDAIDNSAFFIPVLSPFYFSRPRCREELEIWLSNYKSSDERRRIIPIKFLSLPRVQTGQDRLRDVIDTLQYVDFTSFRNNRSLRGKLAQEISRLAARIVLVLSENSKDS